MRLSKHHGLNFEIVNNDEIGIGEIVLLPPFQNEVATVGFSAMADAPHKGSTEVVQFDRHGAFVRSDLALNLEKMSTSRPVAKIMGRLRIEISDFFCGHRAMELALETFKTGILVTSTADGQKHFLVYKGTRSAIDLDEEEIVPVNSVVFPAKAAMFFPSFRILAELCDDRGEKRQEKILLERQVDPQEIEEIMFAEARNS